MSSTLPVYPTPPTGPTNSSFAANYQNPIEQNWQYILQSDPSFINTLQEARNFWGSEIYAWMIQNGIDPTSTSRNLHSVQEIQSLYQKDRQRQTFENTVQQYFPEYWNANQSAQQQAAASPTTPQQQTLAGLQDQLRQAIANKDMTTARQAQQQIEQATAQAVDQRNTTQAQTQPTSMDQALESRYADILSRMPGQMLYQVTARYGAPLSPMQANDANATAAWVQAHPEAVAAFAGSLQVPYGKAQNTTAGGGWGTNYNAGQPSAYGITPPAATPAPSSTSVRDAITQLAAQVPKVSQADQAQATPPSSPLPQQADVLKNALFGGDPYANYLSKLANY